MACTSGGGYINKYNSNGEPIVNSYSVYYTNTKTGQVRAATVYASSLALAEKKVKNRSKNYKINKKMNRS